MNEEIEAIKKYARTTITNEDGTITTARLNLNTGEIKPYKYNKHKEEIYSPQESMFKRMFASHYSKQGDLLEYIPFWALHSVDNKGIKEVRSFKPRLNKHNNNNVFLSDYMCLGHALEDLKLLDNLFEGVSLLDDGNKDKPMNKSLMFNLLRDLDTINSHTIQEYTGYSERHCRKLAQYLRVLSNAFDSEIER